MADAKKARITIGGVQLAGTQAVAWKFVGGVAPYTTTFSVHRAAWERLRGVVGRPLTLEIVDSRGVSTKVEQVYILHEAPSDTPHRVSFVVADKRWKWAYKLIARDFNMPRKTGDRTAFNTVPIEAQTVVDKYDFLSYSLDGERRWTAQRAVEEVLRLLEPQGAAGTTSFRIESFPIRETSGRGDAGEFTLQGVSLRDSGDVALSRLLSYVPGADVYIDAKGSAVLFDATDLDAVEQYFRQLPPTTYAGEAAAWVDRVHIRPGSVIVHYQREVECLFRFSDDYGGGTQATPNRSEPFLENVLPTVDPTTTISDFDPESGQVVQKQVPPGTWVPVNRWLAAMDATRPADSFPWTFDTIRRHWLKGDLDGVLGARGLDLAPTANVALRVQALKQHFRQTFRINRRYMERVRDILAVRVALLDPVTGARAPAAVWAQACSVPSTKGKYMASRSRDPERTKVFLNLDYIAPSEAGTPIVQTPPGPAAVNILDHELGIFRVEWILSPYGLVESFLPCHLVQEGSSGVPVSITRDLALQDDKPVGAAMKVESGTNGIFLRDTLHLAVLLTIVPAAPNNERQFHRIEVEADNVAPLFRREFRIKDGQGPPLEVFIPPGEATARFAWANDAAATSTIQQLLGLNDQAAVGLAGDLSGFVLINEQRHLQGHSASVAAELLTPFADNVQGQMATRVPDDGLRLVGNMAGAVVRVAIAPSAKVDAVHQFPGQQRQISRFAVMPESTRQIVLGTIPFKD